MSINSGMPRTMLTTDVLVRRSQRKADRRDSARPMASGKDRRMLMTATISVIARPPSGLFRYCPTSKLSQYS
jgi:hypothetical protein